MIDYAINTFNNIRYYYVLNTLLSTIMQPSLNKSIRRSTSSFPVRHCWLACTSPLSRQQHAPPYGPTSATNAGLILRTLDVALLLRTTRPKAFYEGCNEVTDVWFRQLQENN